jgi:hypothetical protein
LFIQYLCDPWVKHNSNICMWRYTCILNFVCYWIEGNTNDELNGSPYVMH